MEAGDDVSFEQLLTDWSNEANGQCLGEDVQHIVFHVGRYHLCAKAKSWIKHHNRLQIPSTFKCAQRTSIGHVGHGTFFLRGVIAHQGEELISGHYVTLLVEGDAVWSADDGQCPQAQTAIPEIFQTGAVMIWASKAEHSQFWTRTIGTFEPPPKRPRLTGEGIEFFYSNITQWNTQAKEWLLQTEHHTVAMVETHLQGSKMDQVKAALCRTRWQAEFLPAHETGRGGNSGGRLFCCREGQSAYRLHHFDKDGNGFLANVLQRQKREIVLVSLYLKCGEDLNSLANSTVLGELAAFLRELAVPWIIIGDFQVPPEQWEGHHLLNVLKAEWQATLINGAEIDYVLASCNVVPFLELQVQWEAPWKHHAGLLLKVNKAAPRLILPQLTQFAAVPKLEDAARSWDDFKASPKLFWLGRPTGPKEQQCAEWCHQAEQYVLQNLTEPRQGRGWYLAFEKPLPTTKPLTPWKKGDLVEKTGVASKGRLTANSLVHLKAKAEDLDRRWQEVHGKEAFVAALETLVSGESWPLTLLIKGAEANRDFAKKLALEQQFKEFQVWLAQAFLRGHSGIYRSLKAPDAVHVRPFRTVPVQDRQQMREKQWYGQWEVIDKPIANGERERLRWEAIQQARRWEDLDPHMVMKRFQKLPQKLVAQMASAMHYSRTCQLKGSQICAICSAHGN